MQINSSLIKAEREKRAWSQEHLATAAGVGLRTIQRVESTGIASNETAKALAAVFECEVDAFRVQPRVEQTIFWKRAALAGTVVLSALLLFGAVIATRAQAEEIMLDVVLKPSDKDASVFKMLTEDGIPTEAKLDKEVRLIFLPTTKNNDSILISAEIYGYDGTQYVLVSQPKVLTKNGVEAKIQVGAANGKTYDITVKPQKH